MDPGVTEDHMELAHCLKTLGHDLDALPLAGSRHRPRSVDHNHCLGGVLAITLEPWGIGHRKLPAVHLLVGVVLGTPGIDCGLGNRSPQHVPRVGLRPEFPPDGFLEAARDSSPARRPRLVLLLLDLLLDRLQQLVLNEGIPVGVGLLLVVPRLAVGGRAATDKIEVVVSYFFAAVGGVISLSIFRIFT